MRRRSILRRVLHTYEVDQRHAALAHSYLHGMLLQKTCTSAKILVMLPLSVCFLLASYFLYALNPETLGFTSKVLHHQTASFLEGVPYSHLQGCLNYLISDPAFDVLLIENS